MVLNLKELFGKKYRVTMEESWNNETSAIRSEIKKAGGIPDYYEIKGRRGSIFPWDSNRLEMYLKSTHLAVKIDRDDKYFVPKDRYDDAVSYLFKPEHIDRAVKYIQGRKRRHLSPEQRKVCSERISKWRLVSKKPS